MRISSTFVIVAVLTGVAAPAAAQQLGATITLEQAVSRSLSSNPSLGAAADAAAAAAARVDQAGLLPNPELEIEVEGFGGGGQLHRFDAAESTAVISQPLLLGGKRSHRRGVALAEQSLAERDLEAVRLDIRAATTAAFYRLLAAQQRVELARQLLGLAEELGQAVQARVEAGKVSPLESQRAGIEVARAKIALARAERERAAARARLAASWGSSTPTVLEAVGELPEPAEPPSLERLRQRLGATPEAARLDDLIEHRQRVVDLEKSFRLPDLEVRIGPRHLRETGQTAWVAGISVPIPLFDRNQGARRAARLELESSRKATEAARVALEAELAVTLERLRVAASEATTLARDVVPAATDALAATEQGYALGKFALLAVLDAQGTLFEARSLHLDSLEAYALALTELGRLTGG